VSVALVHPAKAVGRNEMPFGMHTCVVPCNIVLDGGHGPPAEREDLGGRNPESRAISQPPLTVNIFTSIR